MYCEVKGNNVVFFNYLHSYIMFSLNKHLIQHKETYTNELLEKKLIIEKHSDLQESP